MKKLALALLIAVCLAGTAAADSISFSGTVQSSRTETVYAPIGGMAEEVPVRVGDTVTADTVIAKIRTTKVYAAEDGTVTAVYGQPGDDAETVAERYGAVIYMEGPYTLMVSTTTNKAYEEKENFIVHPGETVYVVSRSKNSTKGKGIVTTVDGNSYTVLLTEGSFLMSDSVNICRSSSYSLTSSLGRGNISRVSPTAVTGTGSIVSIAVQPGDKVSRGQLLFETAEGGYDGLVMTGTEIRAGVDGVISSLSVEQGTSVTKGNMVADIYPKDAVWVSAEVTESDLKELTAGQKVKVELDWNEHLGVSYEGTVEKISALGTVGEESTTYTVYVSFKPDENTRYNMTALVSTLEDGQEAGAAEEPDGEAEPEAGAEEEREKPEEGAGTEEKPGERGSGFRPGAREGQKQEE